jgi:hypothetical protein
VQQLPGPQRKTHALEHMAIAAPDMDSLDAKTFDSRIHEAASLTKSKS